MRLVTILLCALASWSAHAKLSIATSSEDLAAIARVVGGDAVDVHSLTPGSANPHYAEAKPSMIRRLSRADALFIIGAGLEAGWLPPLLENARNAKVLPGGAGYLDVSSAVTLLDKPQGPVSRAQGDVHAQGNPHYWLDPRNGARMAHAIAERLAQLDGGGAAQYRANAARFDDTLATRYREWRRQLAPLDGQAVIAYHTSLAYLADAFGFRIVDHVEPKPGIPPNAAHLQQLLVRIEKEKVQLLLVEPFYETRSGKYLAEHAGIKIAVIPQSVGASADAKDYLSLFDAIVAAIRASGALP